MSCCASVDATERFLFWRPVAEAPSTPLSTAAVVIASTIAPAITSTRTDPRSRATLARRRVRSGGVVGLVARTGGWGRRATRRRRRNECREGYRRRRNPALEPWGRNRHLAGGHRRIDD